MRTSIPTQSGETKRVSILNESGSGDDVADAFVSLAVDRELPMNDEGGMRRGVGEFLYRREMAEIGEEKNRSDDVIEDHLGVIDHSTNLEFRFGSPEHGISM
ncbi:hypothetical protein ACHAWO_003982 [Cyclotella atomus]|uniref:Uncharacterized protein n=1 Tax=Cyclotella atomus TaxID=382360 RepID=A0ABD3NYN6_9STRA